MSSSFRSYIRLTYFLYLSNAPGTGTSTVALPFAFLSALLIAGCGDALFRGDHECAELDANDQTPLSESSGLNANAPVPPRAGRVLIIRDGDLHPLEEQSERQLTHSGDYRTGALTRDGSLIAIRQADEGPSLVRLEVEASKVTETTYVALNRLEILDRMRLDDLVPSPDAEHVLVRGQAGYVLVALDSGRETELPPSCCVSWSPDGTLVALLSPGKDQEGTTMLDRRYDLWVVGTGVEAIPRRLATGLMMWSDRYGRDAESVAWWKDSRHILALSSAGVTVIERAILGASLRAPVNNQMVSIDVTTGEVRHLWSSSDLRQRMEQEAAVVQDEILITAAASTKVTSEPPF